MEGVGDAVTLRPSVPRATQGAWGKVLHGCGAFRRALGRMVTDDALNLSQSAAYSAIFAVFPMLVVAAAVVPMLPDTTPVRAQLGIVFARVLPAQVLPLLEGYFAPNHGAVYHSTRALLLGVLVSVWGASGVIATLMEGLRRAYGQQTDCWTFVQRRLRALLLVFLSLLPLLLASMLVVFGQYLALLFAAHARGELRGVAYVVALVIRWSIAAAGSVGLMALLYRVGSPLRQRWRATLPGAFLATGLWLLLTIAFGWYVTRFANYSKVYGSLGAGVALLVWLFLVVLCVLFGAEFNGQLRAAKLAPRPGAAAMEEARR